MGKGYGKSFGNYGEWKGDGKGDGKGEKGKGKGYQGTCWKCGKVGHKALECRSQGINNVEEEQGDEVELGGVWMVAAIDTTETGFVPVKQAKRWSSKAADFCLHGTGCLLQAGMHLCRHKRKSIVFFFSYHGVPGIWPLHPACGHFTQRTVQAPNRT